LSFFPAPQGANWVARLAPPSPAGLSFERHVPTKQKRPQEMQALGQIIRLCGSPYLEGGMGEFIVQNDLIYQRETRL